MNEQRSGGAEEPASPKGASASMTLAAAALESHNTPERASDAVADGADALGADAVSGGGGGASASASQASTSASASAVGRGVGGGASGGGSKMQQQQQQPQLNATDVRELREIKQLLWGDNVREDVFKRWSQGNTPPRFLVFIFVFFFRIIYPLSTYPPSPSRIHAPKARPFFDRIPVQNIFVHVFS